MRIGLFADTHDHLDNVRAAVRAFNERNCDLALFAGDFVSTFVMPKLRPLSCPLLGCFGDNDGNKLGLRNGLGGLGAGGIIAEGPIGLKTPDGCKILLTHMLRDLRGFVGSADVVVFAHTHRAMVRKDVYGRLLVNPGETSGWSYRKPTVAVLETPSRDVEVISLLDGTSLTHRFEGLETHGVERGDEAAEEPHEE